MMPKHSFGSWESRGFRFLFSVKYHYRNDAFTSLRDKVVSRSIRLSVFQRSAIHVGLYNTTFYPTIESASSTSVIGLVDKSSCANITHLRIISVYGSEPNSNFEEEKKILRLMQCDLYFLKRQYECCARKNKEKVGNLHSPIKYQFATLRRVLRWWQKTPSYLGNT